MTRKIKMLDEEKVLRKAVCGTRDPATGKTYYPFSSGRVISLLITAFEKAVREDCISIYYDWESRPKGCAGITFPDAVRGNKRWRETAAIRKGR